VNKNNLRISDWDFPLQLLKNALKGVITFLIGITPPYSAPLKLLPFYRFLEVELRRFGSGQQSELRIIGLASQLKDVRLKN
jgi:hypothetical protein